MTSQRKISRLVRRLAQASPQEVLFRARQQAWNRAEALRSRLGWGFAAENQGVPEPPVSPQAGRFFFSDTNLPELIHTLRAKLPQAAEETIERAERICAHRFDLLGYGDLDLGPRLDWHRDPVHQKTAPRDLFYRVPYLDFAAVGDSKIIWELNRHQHFMTLGKAYQLTGKADYFLEFEREYYDWQEQNPYLVGINWASSLEVAFRSLSWLWAGVLFSRSRAFSARFKRDLLLALGRNARFIEHNLSTYFAHNTHLLGEAVALFFIGVLCPQLGRAAAWQALGWKIILQEAEHQVRSDGGYFEQATYYHVYALDLLLHARILASRNGIAIPESLDQTLQNMLDYLAALSAAGPVSRFGDDDGGRCFDPRRNRAEHLSDPLSTGAALFRRPDWKARATGLAEETLWLLGPAGVTEYDALPDDAPKVASRAFPATGVYVLASDRLRLTMDAGPFGTGNCGHAHADALSLTVAADGHEWLTDRGTCTYTGSDEWREVFRGTAAHNTLRIDGQNQAAPAAPFKWEKIPEVRAEHWWTGEHFDLLVASHNGYQRLASPATHQRMVFFVKPRFWLVIDTVEGAGEHKLELYWHAASGPATLISTALEIGSREGEKFGIVPLSDPGWSLGLADSWHSPSYGQRLPAPVLRCSIQASLPADFATLLIPRLPEPLGQLARLTSTTGVGKTRGFRYGAGRESHSWVLGDGHGQWQLEDFESDARFAYCAQNAQGKPFQVFLWEGSFLSVQGVKVVDLPSRRDHFEEVRREGEETVQDESGHADGVLAAGLREQRC